MNLSRRTLLAAIAALPAVPIGGVLAQSSDRDDNTGTPKPPAGTPALDSPATAAQDTWTFRGDAARTGQMPGPGWSSAPKTMWATNLGTALRSVPAVADGVVVVGAGSLGIGAVVAVDASDGTELWRYAAQGPVISSPTIADAVVYAADAQGSIIALDLTTGELRWEHATEGYVHGSPAVVDGIVYASCDGNQVYALEARTGSPIWTFDRGLGASGAPAVADGLVFVGAGDFGADDPSIYALDAVTGEERWRQSLGSWVISAPTVVDRVVYVASSAGALVASRALVAGFDVQTGDEVWRMELDDSIGASILVDAEAVYVTSNLNKLMAVDRADQETRWEYDDAGENETMPDSYGPVFASGLIYAPTTYAIPDAWSEGIVALDPATGSQRWSWAGPSADLRYTSPAIVGGVVYTAGEDGFLYAIGSD